MRNADEIIFDIGIPEEKPALGTAEAGLFFVGLKKFAEADVLPSTLEDTEGFAVPVDQVVTALVPLITQCLYLQNCRDYFSAVLQDCRVCGGGYMHHDTARFFLRRLAVLAPGTQLPPIPSPPPVTDEHEACHELIAGEQSLMAQLKALRAMVGSSPMALTIDEELRNALRHLDELRLECPPQGAVTKAAHVTRAVKLAHVRLKAAAAPPPSPSPGAVLVPEPGAEPVEAYVAREKELQAAQLANENAFLRQQNAEVSSVAAQSMAAADNAAAQNEQLQQQTALSQQQTAEAMEAATAAETNAAEQANAKMQLSMRIQQMRQELANLAAQDPTQEEGVGFPEEAGSGSPLTQAQQAAQDPAAAVPQDANAAKQQQQAQRAQDEAAQQTQQAVAASAPKTAGLIAAVRRTR